MWTLRLHGEEQTVVKRDMCNDFDHHCCCAYIFHTPPSCVIQTGVKYHGKYKEQGILNKIYMLSSKHDIYFAVVRNPYTRLLSEYWWQFHDLSNRHPKPSLSVWCTKQHLNEWINMKFDTNGVREDMKATSFNAFNDQKIDNDCHFVPQWRFTHDINGERVVSHILHTENLTTEFNLLMEWYDISIQMDVSRSKNKNRYTDCKEIQLYNIGEYEMKLIQNAYKKDFEMFGYDINDTNFTYH